MGPDSAVFVKRRANAPPGFFRAEAAGLAWLGETDVVSVPQVHSVTETSIAMKRISLGSPTRSGATEFGRSLARMHAAGAPGFGAPWPGFIGPLAMDNEGADGWADFYAQRRLLPFVRQARDLGALHETEARPIEQVADRLTSLVGPSGNEPPSRIHGDLWSGNVVWDHHGKAWLVDPAAHGGHRETDLAMLALFGFPELDRVLGAYQETWPLAEGWQRRVGIHQLHPLVVHAVLFGPAYAARAAAAARAALT